MGGGCFIYLNSGVIGMTKFIEKNVLYLNSNILFFSNGTLLLNQTVESLNWKENVCLADEMVGRHHQLDGHEFEQALGVGDGQGRLACCSPRGRKELDTTERLN